MTNKRGPSDFYVLGVIDVCGNRIQTVCEDRSDIILLEALGNDGSYHNFESDAYHLERWAEEHGLGYFEYGYEFEQLGKPRRVYADV